MSKITFILFFVFHVQYVLTGTGRPWGYDKNDGPLIWHNDYPVCAGMHQSPISIDVSKVVVNKSLTAFNLENIKTVSNVKMTLGNNGHSVQVDLTQHDLMLSGGGLPGTFKVKQFHFHWGSEDKRGSEHDINGLQYPMEMHIVMYDNKYASFDTAANKTDGLAVFSFLFEIGTENHKFDEIITHLSNISHKDDHVILHTFALDSLFPQNTDVYYRYKGSLTTPPCYESVIWTIFKNHISVSEKQIEKFRHQVHKSYINETEREISDDFRPVQNLNNRVVMTNDDRGLVYSGACVACSEKIILLILLSLCFIYDQQL